MRSNIRYTLTDGAVNFICTLLLWRLLAPMNLYMNSRCVRSFTTISLSNSKRLLAEAIVRTTTNPSHNPPLINDDSNRTTLLKLVAPALGTKRFLQQLHLRKPLMKGGVRELLTIATVKVGVCCPRGCSSWMSKRNSCSHDCRCRNYYADV